MPGRRTYAVLYPEGIALASWTGSVVRHIYRFSSAVARDAWVKGRGSDPTCANWRAVIQHTDITAHEHEILEADVSCQRDGSCRCYNHLIRTNHRRRY